MISARTQRSRQRGQWAEAIAATYLKAQGLCELKRNYRCPAGEIDIIMQHQATLVFVEVRYRADDRYGHALETIIPRKQRRLLKTAWHYLQTHPGTARLPARFDVVTVGGGQEKPTLEWIKGAFEASSQA
ncbi:MAG TPA: YraN family protein [Gammaproteobacteria bacterium]|jgi:putative endonuclease|nr:YraN family protein [Gammaproteobacteria bacterium]